MNKQEFYKNIQKIETAYNKKFSKEELMLWFKEFMTTEAREFEKAVNKTIKEVKFTPKIADVRARIAVNPNDYYVDDPKRNLYKNLEWGEFIDERK